MKPCKLIITVAVNPCWDTLCRGKSLDWGRHEVIDEKSTRPGGKALNVSRALAWMSTKNTAAGLWGQDDLDLARKHLADLTDFLRIAFTAASGVTRENITVVDTTGNREMHLRSVSHLASKSSLLRLRQDLAKIVTPDSICVFGGSMPQGKLLAATLDVIAACRDKGASLVIDTSGEALARIVAAGGVWLMKPNVDELRELLSQDIADSPEALLAAAQGLRANADNVLISRGPKGAIITSHDEAWTSQCTMPARKLHTTVGCGDYLLAGVLNGLTSDLDMSQALQMGVRAATAHAWGLAQQGSWESVGSVIEVSEEKCQ